MPVEEVWGGLAVGADVAAFIRSETQSQQGGFKKRRRGSAQKIRKKRWRFGGANPLSGWAQRGCCEKVSWERIRRISDSS